jgi:hypothetical protein
MISLLEHKDKLIKEEYDDFDDDNFNNLKKDNKKDNKKN